MLSITKLLANRVKLRVAFLATSILVFTVFSLMPVFTAFASPGSTTENSSTVQQFDTVTKNGNTAVKNQKKTKNTQNTSAQTCENAAGPLSFFLCPVFSQIMEAINWLVDPKYGVLTDMLKLDPLQFNNDQGLHRAYMNVLNLADTLFILVFLIMIFASFVSSDNFLSNYNIKSTMPRLIAAIIIAQFGYLACAILIDFGNILGSLLPTTIMNGVLGSNASMPSIADGVVSLLAFGNSTAVGTGTATVTNAVFFGGGGVVFFLLLIMAVVALFALLVAFIYMVARSLVLIILIFSAPLAFLAWVLPGTQVYFNKWGKTLVRLVFMYPLVTVLITTAEVVSFMLLHPSFDPTVFTTDKLKLLIGGLVPLVALLMIPRCLRLSGTMVEHAGGALAGYMTGRATGGLRSGYSSSRDRLAESDFGKENRFGRSLAGGGLMALASPNSGNVTRKLGEARSRAASVYDKAGAVGTDNEVKAMLNSRNTVERQAAIKALAKRGNRAAIQDAFDARKIKPIDMAALKTTDFKEFSGMPDFREYSLAADGSYTFDESKFFSGLNAGSVMDASPSTQKDWFLQNTMVGGKAGHGSYSASKVRRVQAAQLQNILKNPKLQSKMSEEVRKGLAAYAAHYGTSDMHGAAILEAMDTNGVWKS